MKILYRDNNPYIRTQDDREDFIKRTYREERNGQQKDNYNK